MSSSSLNFQCYKFFCGPCIGNFDCFITDKNDLVHLAIELFKEIQNKASTPAEQIKITDLLSQAMNQTTKEEAFNIIKKFNIESEIFYMRSARVNLWSSVKYSKNGGFRPLYDYSRVHQHVKGFLLGQLDELIQNNCKGALEEFRKITRVDNLKQWNDKCAANEQRVKATNELAKKKALVVEKARIEREKREKEQQQEEERIEKESQAIAWKNYEANEKRRIEALHANPSVIAKKNAYGAALKAEEVAKNTLHSLKQAAYSASLHLTCAEIEHYGKQLRNEHDPLPDDQKKIDAARLIVSDAEAETRRLENEYNDVFK